MTDTSEEQAQQEMEDRAAELVESYREPLVTGLTNEVQTVLLHSEESFEDDESQALLRAIYEALGWDILTEVREEVLEAAADAQTSVLLFADNPESQKVWQTRVMAWSRIDGVLFDDKGWPDSKEQAEQWWEEIAAELEEELGE